MQSPCSTYILCVILHTLQPSHAFTHTHAVLANLLTGTDFAGDEPDSALSSTQEPPGHMAADTPSKYRRQFSLVGPVSQPVEDTQCDSRKSNFTGTAPQRFIGEYSMIKPVQPEPGAED